MHEWRGVGTERYSGVSESAFDWAPGELIAAIKRRSVPDPKVVEPWVDITISLGVILASFTSDVRLYLHDGLYYVGKIYDEGGAYRMYVEESDRNVLIVVGDSTGVDIEFYESGPWENVIEKYQKIVRAMRKEGKAPFENGAGIGIVRETKI